ncbi:PIN domain-containing protein [Hymenobacter rubidus]|uniref:PIN domain-containing protein n=1 Tax=Hymenobacter rubidus TaxID=1441626 RepID=UPI00191F83CC|nr:PIN domain-containing protein [Hymenobacter rubidus]
MDTNVVIDYLAQRQPFWLDAAELMQAGLDKQTRLYVASLSFANIYYILRRVGTAEKARELLVRLERLVRIVTVDDIFIRQALASTFSDFEDGIQHFAAVSVSASAIVTRDYKDFQTSLLPVISPAQALLEI